MCPPVFLGLFTFFSWSFSNLKHDNYAHVLLNVCLSILLYFLSNCVFDFSFSFVCCLFIDIQLIFMILYPDTLLNSVLWVCVFIIPSLRFPMETTMSSANIVLFLPFCLNHSFPCIIAMARISITMLNRSGDGKHLCLICYWSQEDSFLYFTIIMFAIHFLYSIRLRKFLLIPNLLNGIIILLSSSLMGIEFHFFSASIEIFLLLNC